MSYVSPSVNDNPRPTPYAVCVGDCSMAFDGGLPHDHLTVAFVRGHDIETRLERGFVAHTTAVNCIDGLWSMAVWQPCVAIYSQCLLFRGRHLDAVYVHGVARGTLKPNIHRFVTGNGDIVVIVEFFDAIPIVDTLGHGIENRDIFGGNHVPSLIGIHRCLVVTRFCHVRVSVVRGHNTGSHLAVGRIADGVSGA